MVEKKDAHATSPIAPFDAYRRCVRLGDSFPPQFCNNWTEPSSTLGYRAEMRGTTLLIAHRPFWWRDDSGLPRRRAGGAKAGV
jgi:hypothetical protein